MTEASDNESNEDDANKRINSTHNEDDANDTICNLRNKIKGNNLTITTTKEFSIPETPDINTTKKVTTKKVNKDTIENKKTKKEVITKKRT